MAENDHVQKIPFQVSARTARLIGRENIATYKGAIIELVKNCYDADGSVCIVYFDNYYATVRKNMSVEHYNKLIHAGISKNVLSELYHFDEEIGYALNKGYSEDTYLQLKLQLRTLASLYIIDDGEGMTDAIIKNNWMVIGTDNKSVNFKTRKGRIKAGAKGIGRFALDKLGSKCKMSTFVDPSYHTIENPDCIGYEWCVNWEDFEGRNKTISEVSANLYCLSQKENMQSVIVNYLPDIFFSKIKDSYSFKHGTVLKIFDLRESSEDYYIEQIYSDLETLVPPRELSDFSVYVFSSLEPEKYGRVSEAFCDDFDYKLVAEADEQQNVTITVSRNEQDLRLIPLDFFKRKTMSKKEYQRETFEKGSWTITSTFSQLLPGYEAADKDNTFAQIGRFSFTFFYLKRSYNKQDAERFFYKRFSIRDRKDWLDKFGGIKLFRDNFRVRPYGEPKDIAFDWLGLGARKASSPAGIAKKGRGYRVEPENVAGAITISRLTNINFDDKSSREGLQENKAFTIFKSIILALINIFEQDRSYIAYELASFDEERFSEKRQRSEAEKVANRILEEQRVSGKIGGAASKKSPQETDLVIVAELSKQQSLEIEKLKEEQKVLRGLASCGIVLASFSHDLSYISGKLNSRADKIKRLIAGKISENEYNGTEDRLNPFLELEKIKHQDLKLKNWLNFSLGAARKDKRTRKNIQLKKYFTNFVHDWMMSLDGKDITVDISRVTDIEFRVFEIDMDSIFNNLLINSIDAFLASMQDRKRKIYISAKEEGKFIVIDYYDNGPGLSKDIIKPDLIFEPLFTTKRNAYSGEEEGTGLGMWIIKSIVEENDGTTNLLYPDIGFGIRIIFPIKFRG